MPTHNLTLLNKASRLGILFYQATISHFLGGNCRYYPSCSHYASEAFEKHTFGTAFFLVLKRLLSCHPLSRKNFYDPVPVPNYVQQRGLSEHT